MAPTAIAVAAPGGVGSLDLGKEPRDAADQGSRRGVGRALEC